MAQIPTFSLPVLNTQYETIQKTPTSNWMTALNAGLQGVGELASGAAEARKIQEEKQKRKDLEVMLNVNKTNKDRLDELLRMKDELTAELDESKRQDYLTTEANKAKPLETDAIPSSIAFTKFPGYEGFTPNVEEPKETMSSINTSGFNFGFTPMILPQLRG